MILVLVYDLPRGQACLDHCLLDKYIVKSYLCVGKSGDFFQALLVLHLSLGTYSGHSEEFLLIVSILVNR